MENKFQEKIVGITGYSLYNPSYDEMISRIIELEGGIVSGDRQKSEEWEWEVEQIVIIGEEDFDKNYLIQSVEVGIENNFTCQYFSLEDFWDFYTECELYEPYFEGDERIEKHAGLAFLASLYFEYPNVDIFGFGNRRNQATGEWSEESILRANFGYSVRSGISRKERRNTLETAVSSPQVISLQAIAEQIVFNINLRKGQSNMKSAIRRWMEDLKWLKEEHYDSSIHSFKFPRPD